MEIDLKPGLTVQQLDARLLRDFEKFINKDFSNALDELLPRKLIPVAVRLSGIAPDTKVNQITREEREKLISVIKAFPVTPVRFRPVEEAIVTSGGVKVSEVDPHTMRVPAGSGAVLYRGSAGSGRLYRRLQPSDRLFHRPPGSTVHGRGRDDTMGRIEKL